MQEELCHKPRYAFIGLKGSAEELQLTASNLWALPSKDLEKDVQIETSELFKSVGLQNSKWVLDLDTSNES